MVILCFIIPGSLPVISHETTGFTVNPSSGRKPKENACPFKVFFSGAKRGRIREILVV